MSNSLPLFLDYFENLPDEAKHDHGEDVARAYHDSVAELAELKESGRLYIVPGKDSRGRWVPVFDEDCVDEVANLATQISDTKAKLESIANDIEEIVSLGDGPGVWSLVTKLQELRHRVRTATAHVTAESTKAIQKNPGMPLAEINQLPAVIEAYGNLAAVKAEAEPEIAVLSEKFDRRQAIYTQYEA